MATERKFYRTVYEVEVLSEVPFENQSLDIGEAVADEDSVACKTLKQEVVDGPAMAKLLAGQGSDPEFFQLDIDGNDYEESVSA